MRLTEQVYLVGSGALGFNETDAYDCNIYLIDGGSERMLIDCGSGMGVEAILSNLNRLGYQATDINWIVVTHNHADHSGGAHELRLRTGAKIICSQRTASIVQIGESAMGLKAAKEQGIYPKDYHFIPITPDLIVRDGEQIMLGELSIQFLETPGHSFDQISVYCPELEALFCSDVIFAGGKIAVQQAADFSLVELEQSIRKMSKLQITDLYPGHWEPLRADRGATLHQAIKLFDAGIIPGSIV